MSNVKIFPSKKKPAPVDLNELHLQVIEDVLDQYAAVLQKNRVNEWFISKLPSYALPRHTELHEIYLSLSGMSEIERKLKMHVVLECNNADSNVTTGFVYNGKTYRNVSDRLLRLKLNELNARMLNIVVCNTFTIRSATF